MCMNGVSVYVTIRRIILNGIDDILKQENSVPMVIES